MVWTEKGYDSEKILKEADMTIAIPPKKIVKFNVTMIKRSTNIGTSWRMLFYTSSAGGVLLLVMQKIPPLFSMLYKFDAWRYGSIFHDDTMQELAFMKGVLCG